MPDLHSYAPGALPIFQWTACLVVVHFVLIALGCIPVRFWRSADALRDADDRKPDATS